MKIPLESRAHVIFTYTLVQDKKGNLCLHKVYYSGMGIRVPKKYGLESISRMLSKSKDFKEIEMLGLKTGYSFRSNVDEALTFRYNEVFEEAEKLKSEVIASMYVESLNEEWTPF